MMATACDSLEKVFLDAEEFEEIAEPLIGNTKENDENFPVDETNDAHIPDKVSIMSVNNGTPAAKEEEIKDKVTDQKLAIEENDAMFHSVCNSSDELNTSSTHDKATASSDFNTEDVGITRENSGESNDVEKQGVLRNVPDVHEPANHTSALSVHAVEFRPGKSMVKPSNTGNSTVLTCASSSDRSSQMKSSLACAASVRDEVHQISFIVSVCNVDGEYKSQQQQLTLRADTSVAKLKTIAEHKLGIPAASQRWVMGACAPKDHMTLSQCGLQDSYTAYVYVKRGYNYTPKGNPTTVMPVNQTCDNPALPQLPTKEKVMDSTVPSPPPVELPQIELVMPASSSELHEVQKGLPDLVGGVTDVQATPTVDNSDNTRSEGQRIVTSTILNGGSGDVSNGAAMPEVMRNGNAVVPDVMQTVGALVHDVMRTGGAVVSNVMSTDSAMVPDVMLTGGAVVSNVMSTDSAMVPDVMRTDGAVVPNMTSTGGAVRGDNNVSSRHTDGKVKIKPSMWTGSECGMLSGKLDSVPDVISGEQTLVFPGDGMLDVGCATAPSKTAGWECKQCKTFNVAGTPHCLGCNDIDLTKHLTEETQQALLEEQQVIMELHARRTRSPWRCEFCGCSNKGSECSHCSCPRTVPEDDDYTHGDEHDSGRSSGPTAGGITYDLDKSQDMWVCERCTFVNTTPLAHPCGMCGCCNAEEQPHETTQLYGTPAATPRYAAAPRSNSRDNEALLMYGDDMEEEDDEDSDMYMGRELPPVGAPPPPYEPPMGNNQDDNSEWACNRCTFLNEAAHLCCSVCAATRPHTDPLAQVTQPVALQQQATSGSAHQQFKAMSDQEQKQLLAGLLGLDSVVSE